MQTFYDPLYLPFSEAAFPPSKAAASNAVPLTDIIFKLSLDFSVWMALPTEHYKFIILNDMSKNITDKSAIAILMMSPCRHKPRVNIAFLTGPIWKN